MISSGFPASIATAARVRMPDSLRDLVCREPAPERFAVQDPISHRVPAFPPGCQICALLPVFDEYCRMVCVFKVGVGDDWPEDRCR